MAFKTDSSFLRFLTMGAVGVHETIRVLEDQGFAPIELERYCASNKIWMTKVKRLRLPDLLCVRTGLRVEVRAKSDLKIRMSDAPGNPDRRWDVGLRDGDLVAFIACSADSEGVEIRGPPVFCSVGDMRASVGNTKLGPPKSQMQGAERDRTWPTTVPGRDGVVLEVEPTRIRTSLSTGRRQIYELRDKHPYVRSGDAFTGGATIIAGVLPRLASLDEARALTWDPAAHLQADDAVDRYCAAKALPHVAVAEQHQGRLYHLATQESDGRIALELAASAARLGHADGIHFIAEFVRQEDRGDLRMEGVLILSELGTDVAAVQLHDLLNDKHFARDELRQAATWGLGKLGCRRYDLLLGLLDDDEVGVVLHAIAAFGQDTPGESVDALVELLRTGSVRSRAAASEALRMISSDLVLERLLGAARAGPAPWVLATLGRLPADRVRTALSGDPLLPQLEPLLLLTPGENWLATAESAADLRFLESQDL